jgi:hypothetical protein
VTILDALLTRAQSAMTKPGKDMRTAIATAHSAATYAAIAERGDVGKLRTWLSKITRAALPKADRDRLKKAVTEQLKYYDKFAADAAGMSDAAVAARAQLYAGAVRGTYYGAKYPGLSQYPGDGTTQCLTNCKCFLTEKDDGIHWELSPVENCEDCQAMAAGGPYDNKA